MLPANEGLYYVEKSRRSIPEGIVKPSAFLNTFHPLSAKAAKFIDSKAFFCSVPKGRLLLREGVTCPYMFLIVKGVMRAYILEGKAEITTWIVEEVDLISSISSFFNQSASFENIQALEDCDLIGLSFQDLETAYEKYPEMNIAARKILQGIYRQAEVRAYLARLTKASGRYAFFANSNQALLSRVPLKYIASFLGMTLETLSRLRGAISRPPKDPQEKTI